MYDLPNSYGCNSIRELIQKCLIFEIIGKIKNNSSHSIFTQIFTQIQIFTHFNFLRLSFGLTKSGLVLVPASNKNALPNEQIFPRSPTSVLTHTSQPYTTAVQNQVLSMW